MKIITWGEELGLSNCYYLKRWVINFWLFSIRLHHWRSSDDRRYFHDHPWWFITVVLKGGYIDVSPQGKDKLTTGSIRWRSAYHRHYVRVASRGCWSLLLTGRSFRHWGFWVKNKFLRARRYFFKFGHHPCEDY